MPGEIGEVVPQRNRLALPIGRHRRHAVIDTDIERLVSHSNGRWLLRNRMAPSQYLTAQHYWLKVISPSEYFETHPEYFSLIGGKRIPKQLCTSNPEVVNLMIEKARLYLTADPTRASFPMDPADGIEFCQCNNCEALDPLETRPDGLKSMTNRVAIFANTVAEGIEKDFPGKKIGFYAYSTHQRIPVNIKLHKNVFIYLCGTDTCALHLMPTNSCKKSQRWWDLLDDWMEVCETVYTYQYVPIAWLGGLPCPMYLDHGYSLNEQAKRGVKGMYFDDSRKCWASDLPLYYMGIS